MKQPAHRLDSFLEGFPTELTQLILCALPDAVALKAAVLSHPSFYHAFSAAKDLILLRVLHNQIPPDLLPHASAVCKSSHIQPWSRKRVQEFLDCYHNGLLMPLSPWTLSDAVPASVLSADISFFLTDFVATALSVHPITGAPEPFPSTLSSSEESRIRRTFYRFELYCNLFRKYRDKDDRFDDREQRELYFDRYSPWENEQLACVHDYLYRRLVKGMSLNYKYIQTNDLLVFNEFAAHDVEWGELGIEYWTDEWYDQDSGWKQGLVCSRFNVIRFNDSHLADLLR